MSLPSKKGGGSKRPPEPLRLSDRSSSSKSSGSEASSSTAAQAARVATGKHPGMSGQRPPQPLSDIPKSPTLERAGSRNKVERVLGDEIVERLPPPSPESQMTTSYDEDLAVDPPTPRRRSNIEIPPSRRSGVYFDDETVIEPEAQHPEPRELTRLRDPWNHMRTSVSPIREVSEPGSGRPSSEVLPRQSAEMSLRSKSSRSTNAFVLDHPFNDDQLSSLKNLRETLAKAYLQRDTCEAAELTCQSRGNIPYSAELLRSKGPSELMKASEALKLKIVRDMVKDNKLFLDYENWAKKAGEKSLFQLAREDSDRCLTSSSVIFKEHDTWIMNL